MRIIDNKPLVSVIMPVYNSEEYIFDAISSIINQTYKNWELIVINDCSTDRTVEVVEGITDKRIRLLSNEENLGIALNRNRGLQESRGEYIAWLDSDDISINTRLEKQVEFLEKNKKYSLCASNACSIDSVSKIISEPWYEKNPLPIEWEFVLRNPIAQSSVMVKKECLRLNNIQYNADFELAEDYDLWTRLAKHSRLYRLDEVLLHYRVLDNSAFRTYREKALNSSMFSNKRYIRFMNHSIMIPKYHEYIVVFNTDETKDECFSYSLKETYLWYKSLMKNIVNYYGFSRKEKSAIHMDIKRAISNNFKSSKDFFRLSEWLNYFLTFDIYFLIKRIIRKIVKK